MTLIPSDLLDLVTIAANIVLVGTLFLLVYQILLERREIRYSIYEKLMSDFSSMALLLVERPELSALTLAIGFQDKRLFAQI